ncbi:endonuclease/exonuclease/phosphatase family protein [Entophlyctis helioformis]|nr:endonuclease/exonuclease/phosphatase family protein [Entophlyctis helioformis]
MSLRFLLATALVGSLAVAAPAPAPAASSHLAARAPAFDAGGVLSVASYNVAGLPAILSSGNPAPSTRIIGERLNRYDIVNVQEDFNYHADLYAGDNGNHAFKTPTSGGAGIGSGLNTLSKFPYFGLDRVKWDDCNGVVNDANDCLTPKGYTFMRVRLAEGAYVDVYNLHTDAGSSDGDANARRKNILQVSRAINERSAGMAVIVMGDTNTRYTRAQDNIRTLSDVNGLTDGWLQFVRGAAGAPAPGSPALVCAEDAPTNDCEVVDKILYRGSRTVSMTGLGWTNDHYDFLDAQGKRLSDHFPISARLSWSNTNDVRVSDTKGGSGGSKFHDVTALDANAAATQVVSFVLRGGKRVDAVGVTLKPNPFAGPITLRHGGSGGGDSVLTLGASEHVVRGTICQEKKDTTRVFYIDIFTNQGRSIRAGRMTSDCATYFAPDGWRVVGFWGSSGSELDNVGFVYARI